MQLDYVFGSGEFALLGAGRITYAQQESILECALSRGQNGALMLKKEPQAGASQWVIIIYYYIYTKENMI